MRQTVQNDDEGYAVVSTKRAYDLTSKLNGARHHLTTSTRNRIIHEVSTLPRVLGLSGCRENQRLALGPTG
jgi:hypothetical protein